MSNFDIILQRTKDLIKENSPVYSSQLEPILKPLSKKERKRILKEVEDDSDFARLGDVFEYTKNISSERDLIHNEILKIEFIDEKTDSIKVGNSYLIGLTITGFPPTFRTANEENIILSDINFIKQILKIRGGIEAKASIEPYPVHYLISYLKRKLRDVKDELAEYYEQGLVENEKFGSLKNQQSMLEKRLQLIKDEQLKAFEVTISFLIKATNLSLAKKLANDVIDIAFQYGIILTPTTNKHRLLLKSMPPNCINYLQRRKIITTDDILSELFMFGKL